MTTKNKKTIKQPRKSNIPAQLSRWPLFIFVIFALTLATALLTRSALQARLLEAIFLVGLISWVLLTGYFTNQHQSSALKELLTPDPNTTFSKKSLQGKKGEHLISFTGFKLLRLHLLKILLVLLILPLLILLGLRTLPVPTYIVSSFALIAALYLISKTLSIFYRTLPAGQRWKLISHLFTPDYRRTFASFAKHAPTGEVTVSYTSYKRLYKVAAATIIILIPLMLIGLGREIYIARLNSEQNLQAAATQFSTFWTALRAGEGNATEEFNKLLSQALEPAATLDENSLAARLINEVTQNLPKSPTQIVKETTIVEKTIVTANTTEIIKLESGGKLKYQDENGTNFITFGGSPKVTIEDQGIFNIKGTLQIDGSTVDVTAGELNDVDNLTEDITFLTLTGNDALDKERLLTAGNGITLTDGGAGNAATIALNLGGVTYTWPTTNGDASEYLQTNGTGTLSWVALTSLGIGNAVASGTAGSVLFVDAAGLLGQDNTNFYWDDSNNRLGIGTTAPSSILQINGTITIGNPTTNGGQINAETNGISIEGNDGTAGLYVYDDQQYLTGNVMVGGVETPKSTLDVEGAISVGAAYSGTSAAPSNGMIIEGNVGIGTTSPADKLEVKGNIMVSGSGLGIVHARIFNDPAGSNSNKLDFSTSNYPILSGYYDLTIQTTGGSSADILINPGGNVGIGTTTPGALLDVAGGITATGDLTVDSTTLYVDSSTNRIGIGTTVADGILHLDNGTSNTDLVIEKDDGTRAAIRFHSASYDLANITLDSSEDLIIENDNTSRDIYIKVNKAGVDTTLMHLDGLNANVGIGTITPQKKLSIEYSDTAVDLTAGAGSTDGLGLQVFNTDNTTSNYAYIDLRTTPASGGGGDSRIASINTGSSNESHLAFLTDNSGLVEVMRLTKDANVGIGTTSPTQLLDVSGNINSTQEILASGTIHSAASLETSGSIATSGDVGIGTASPLKPLQINTTKNAISGANVDVSELSQMILNPADDTGEAVGIGFGLSATATNVGAAIIHERGGTFSFGKLHFATKQSGAGASADIPIRMTIGDSGNLGIGTTAPTEKLHVSGNGYITGSLDVSGNVALGTLASGSDTDLCLVTATSFVADCSSSRRYKENIKDLNTGLEVVEQLNPVTFDWIGSGEHSFGFIAEEVAVIDPLLVTHKGGQIEGVKYKQITAILTNAIQEQQFQIGSLAALLGTDLPAISLSPPTDPQAPSPLTLSIIDRLDALEKLVAASGLLSLRGGAIGDDAAIPSLANEIVSLPQVTRNDDDIVDTLSLTSLTLEGLTVHGDSTIIGDLTLEGKLERANEQTGEIQIGKRNTEVTIKFDQLFENTPIVQLTPLGPAEQYWVSDKDKHGFTINFAAPLEIDTIFEWLAIDTTIQQDSTASPDTDIAGESDEQQGSKDDTSPDASEDDHNEDSPDMQDEPDQAQVEVSPSPNEASEAPEATEPPSHTPEPSPAPVITDPTPEPTPTTPNN